MSLNADVPTAVIRNTRNSPMQAPKLFCWMCVTVGLFLLGLFLLAEAPVKTPTQQASLPDLRVHQM